MENKQFLKLLRSIDACKEAVEWVEKTGYSFEQAYQNCHRGDWLLWLFSKTSLITEENERAFFLAKGNCANTVRNKMTDKRSLAGVDAAIAYGENKISKAELKTAATAAYVAYTAASAAAYAADAAAYAAYTAAYAADAVATAASAPAAYAAAAAAYAAAAAAYAAAAAANRMQTADICRRYLLIEMFNIKD